MRAVLLALVGVAACLAWALARRRPDHRPIAWLLSVGFFGDAAQWAFSAAVIAPLRAELGTSAPWNGWARVAGHVVDAMWLAWPAAIVGAALAVYASRSALPAFVGWAVAVAALVAAHPINIGGMLTAAQMIAAVVSVVLAVAWFRRRKTEPISPAQAVLSFLVAHEIVSLLAVWWAGPFARWNVLQASILLVLGVVITLQGKSLWATTKLSLSSP